MDMSTCIDRFLEPQKASYAIALEEVRNGRKVSHWMWYIFPQLRGLGQSNVAWYIQRRTGAAAFYGSLQCEFGSRFGYEKFGSLEFL